MRKKRNQMKMKKDFNSLKIHSTINQQNQPTINNQSKHEFEWVGDCQEEREDHGSERRRRERSKRRNKERSK